MVGAARLERAMIVTRALVIIAPVAWAGLCIPIPPSAYKIQNQSLEKYSGVLAPTSSMLFLARSMPYRTSHVPSIVELFTRSEIRQVLRLWQVDSYQFWLEQQESNLHSRHQKPMSYR